jgi:DNA repair protein RadA/Sms
VKNRFGSTNEIGVFEMTDAGLKEVANPSAWFLSERPQKATGSVVVASLEGTRPILIELQALVSPTSFPIPRRTANGVDGNRIALLVAVMEKRMGLNLSGQDIYVNVVGGLRIEEPALDLGIVAAVTSSLRNRPIAPTTVVFGEVGLGGEVRAVGHGQVGLPALPAAGAQSAEDAADRVHGAHRGGGSGTGPGCGAHLIQRGLSSAWDSAWSYWPDARGRR